MNTLFDLDCCFENSELILLPVPWEVTTSYGAGASLGPQAILEASLQIDLFNPAYGEFYRRGIFMQEIPQEILEKNNYLKPLAQRYIQARDAREAFAQSQEAQDIIQAINKASEEINLHVYNQAQALLNQGKLVGLIGGDHSSPLGLIQALSEKYSEYGVLHIDAHLDLRKAYQGFNHSHASIMYNVMQLPHPPESLTQVAVRDFCREEYDFNHSHPNLYLFDDARLKSNEYNKISWNEECDYILETLPQNVYVSFDIDGLLPDLCPNTGTPVPGGLSFEKAIFLLQQIQKSGRKVIGFDLCEVAPHPNSDDQWDGNVGMRILFHLCAQALVNN